MSLNFEYKGNTGGKKPIIKLLPFNAGSVNTTEPGQACVLSAGYFVPLAADQGMAGVVVIAQHRITALHAAGYYPALVPQDGDIFKASLATASAAALGASLYVTDATQALAVAGTNVLGNVFDHAGIPLQQGQADTGDVADRGTTIKSVPSVLMTIKKATSYLAALQT